MVRLALDPKQKHRLAGIAMIASLGMALFIGGCGHRTDANQGGANTTPNTNQTGTGQTTGAGITDLTSVESDLNASLNDLNGDLTNAFVDYSNMDQEAQP